MAKSKRRDGKVLYIPMYYSLSPNTQYFISSKMPSNIIDANILFSIKKEKVLTVRCNLILKSLICE